MTDREISYKDIRAILSMFAVSSAVLLCHTLRHFSIALSRPSTWQAATQHRCGWILIATLTWFLCETTYRFCLGGESLRQFDRTN
jgi:Na+/phosphate symporter